jgi:succinylglutamate desuccinylase
MDCVTSTRGHIAMVVEGGQHDDPTSIDVLEAAAWTVIETLCMMPAGESPFGAGGPQAVLDRAADALAGRFFDLRHREAIVSPDFIVLEGLRAFSRVRRGKTAIAQCAGRTLVAPISGLLFMPNRQQVRRIGDDGYFIVQPVGRVWLALSAWLRRLRGVHAMLPRLLPGVRRRPGSDELLVSPMIAVVLKRQVFHLLGYRVVRHGTERHLSRGKRAMLAAMGIARATGVIAAGVLRGGERGVLPVETSEDWIVRRRRLDTDPPRRQGSCS